MKREIGGSSPLNHPKFREWPERLLETPAKRWPGNRSVGSTPTLSAETRSGMNCCIKSDYENQIAGNRGKTQYIKFSSSFGPVVKLDKDTVASKATA